MSEAASTDAASVAAGTGFLDRGLALIISGSVLALLAGCAAQPGRMANGRTWDAKLGVWSSPRLVADGDAVPRGGGSYLTGRPYVIGGRTYVPSRDATGYTVVGTASWYGDAFHGRRTANGEIFDKGSITAAHPTLPLPSYVRVTNLKNGRSLVVRVNDRGPYHGGRVMDVSQRVAEALQFRGEGTARIRVDYIGKAGLRGSDDEKLLATLRTDGSPAQLAGMPDPAATQIADATPSSPAPASPPPSVPFEALQPAGMTARGEDEPMPSFARIAVVPLPPLRPFSLNEPETPQPRRRLPGRRKLAGDPEAEASSSHSIADLLARPERTRAVLNLVPQEAAR